MCVEAASALDAILVEIAAIWISPRLNQHQNQSDYLLETLVVRNIFEVTLLKDVKHTIRFFFSDLPQWLNECGSVIRSKDFVLEKIIPETCTCHKLLSQDPKICLN